MTLHSGLFVTDDSNTVVGPKDARLALAGLLSGTGILSGFAVSGNTNGPNIQYTVGAGTVVVARGDASADGLYIVSNDNPITVDSGAGAPTSGSRYDLVWVRQKNAFTGDGFGDADSQPEAGVTVGVSGPSPAKPSASVPAGALVLAECLVPSTANNGGDATIDNTAPVAGTNAVTTVSDWNSATSIGVLYYGAGAANAPTTSTFSGFVLGDHLQHYTQVVWRVTTVATGLEQWMRIFDGASWSAWQQVASPLSSVGVALAGAVSAAAARTTLGVPTFTATGTALATAASAAAAVSALGLPNAVTITDWNAGNVPGQLYVGIGAANGPGSNAYSGVPVGQWPHVTQFVWRFSSDNTAVEQWARTRGDTSWGPWSRTAGPDTGWLNCAMASGVQVGQMKARVMNGVVYLSGSAILGTAASDGALATLPASVPSPAGYIQISNGADQASGYKSVVRVSGRTITGLVVRDSTTDMSGSMSRGWSVDGISYPAS